MTKLRGYIPTMLMLVTLMFGTTAANAGIIVGGRTDGAKDTNPCEETTDTSLTGILFELASFAKTGIIVGGRAGIIVGGRTSTSSSQDTCGIIVGGRAGIIVGG